MAGRFQRRLTVVRGGAGFGKTTLLLQALERNEAEGAGVDLWLGLSPRDVRPSELSAALRAAVGARGDGDVIDAVADAVWRRSPKEIALILDDVHHVEPNSEGSELLTRLLRELPSNGHLVLVGRHRPPIPMTRLLASGEALEIDEDHLAFTPSEQASFLSMRGANSPTGHRAGWPALVELTATVGAERVESYLWEEILEGLTPERRRGLARLAPLEWIDGDRIAAFTSTSDSVETFVRDLPLTSLEPNGAARLHALWEPVLSSIDPEWTDEDFQRATRHLADGGFYREAVELCLHTGREEDVSPILRDLVQMDWRSMAPESLETLIATLPANVATEPVGEFLKGLLALHNDPMRAEPFIQSAQAGFEAAGDDESAVATLALRSYLAFFRVDSAALEAVAKECEGYGNERARTGAISIRATQALADCRPDDALRLIDEARRRGAGSKMGGADAMIAGMALMDSGQPDRAMGEILAAIPGASKFILPALWGMQFDVMWLSGEIDASHMTPLDGGVPGEARGHAYNQAVASSTLAYENAVLGRVEISRRHLKNAEVLLERGLGDRAEVSYAVGAAGLRAAQGDEAGAAEVIERTFAKVDHAKLIHRQSLGGSALAAVVSPKLRPLLLPWRERGPLWAQCLDAAEALIALREENDPGPATRLPWETYRRFAIALVRPMTLELAVAAAANGVTEAGEVAEKLGVDHRDVLRTLSESSAPAVADYAKTLLRTVPARPAGLLGLNVLGPLELLRDGEPQDDPALRRERVRALLFYLVSHQQATREQLCTALWPELAASAALNNLRVTLSHIRTMLEPERESGAPSYFLPQDGDVVRLRLGDALELDADRFSACIQQAEAADAAGDPGQALALYEEAIALHRGDYLVQSPDPSWGASLRDEIRAQLVGALLRVAELRLGRNELDRAVACMERASEAAPLDEPVLRTLVLSRERRDGHAAARTALLHALRPLEEGGISPDTETCRLATRLGVEVRTVVNYPSEPATTLGLSLRELEVLQLVDRGLSNGEIAEKLFVAPSTVKSHLENVYDKLGVRRRTQAVAIAREQGLLS